jgi:selenocysteine-specific elongation factor
MKNLTVAVIGAYGSGKTYISQSLQQKQSFESDDINVYVFKQGDTIVNLIDVPGGVDTPEIAASALTSSNAFLLVIGADNPITYQLGEFVVMLNTLSMKNGIICITKKDVADADAAAEKVKMLIKDTVLRDAPIFQMSALSPQDIADLRAKILALSSEDRSNLPATFVVDKGFEMRSGGSVALGTLVTGKVHVHDKIMIVPEPLTRELNVASLQLNQEDQEEVYAGSRVGIGLKDMYPWYLTRGVELREPNSYIDIDNGGIEVEVNPLYKGKIENGAKLTLLNHWQSVDIQLNDVKLENNKLKAKFTANKHIVFNENDKILLVNKELPVRMLRILGLTKLSPIRT